MKKLGFQYEMELLLDRPVHDHHYRFQCVPIEDQVQKVENLQARVLPGGSLWKTEDGFGNPAWAGEILGEHDFLRLECEGTVRIDESGRIREPFHPLFLRPGPLTWPEANIREFYQQALKNYVQGGGSPEALDISLAEFLMNQVSSFMTYVPGATQVGTTAAQALELGKGVCQDYAHILVSLCRLAGIPARYTAGIMIGEGATHAWVQVWDQGMWKGLDPTNSREAGEDYIRFSSGRDFSDCAIDRGCFQGFALQTQKILVKVEEIT